MKKLILVLSILSLGAHAVDENKYFKRPLNCPLRFSSLSAFRDQVQTLVSALGTGCTQNGQQAINQLNSNVSNLEGIANTYRDYSSNSDATTSSQYAKNVGQILGSINIITSNNACFYDIRSRGTLPVLADVIMSASQLGLLIPSATGAAVAATGFVAGSTLKIVNELIKKKFNFDKPEERRAFIQLNCAFFDSRRILEESGIFNPESEEFKNQIVDTLRKERSGLIKLQKKNDKNIVLLEDTLNEVINQMPEARQRGLNPPLSNRYDELSNYLGRRPGDYAEKLRQVSFLAERAEEVLDGTKNLKLDAKVESNRKLLVASLEKIMPNLAANASAWTNNIDEYEMHIRGPLLAFLFPVADALKKELMSVEAELALHDQATARKISSLRQDIKSHQSSAWAMNLRLASIETKITSFEKIKSDGIFSENDEGSSNVVEILDYYRKLQNSILGKEGRDYLKNALKTAYNMQEGLGRQLELMNEATTPREKCAAAEKTRFAWTQYRFKVQEAHDFIATNMDLYRSSFRIGDEKLKRPMKYVLNQIGSVEAYQEGRMIPRKSLGDLMKDVASKIKDVESRLQTSGCF